MDFKSSWYTHKTPSYWLVMNLQPNSSLIGPPVSIAGSPINVTTKHLCFAASQGFDKNEQKLVQACLLRMLIECSPRSCNFFSQIIGNCICFNVFLYTILYFLFFPTIRNCNIINVYFTIFHFISRVNI